MAENQKEKLMRVLKLTAEQADELLAYDKAVDRGQKTEYDFTPEQEKATRKYRQSDRKPTNYNFSQRERKPNATKGGLISELFEFLSNNSNFEITNCAVTNKERQITFTVGEANFELTLVQKRAKKE